MNAPVTSTSPGTAAPSVLLLDDQPDDIAGLESAIDQVRRDGQTPFTRQVEGLFHLVREPGEVRETRGCPRSLDGVNGPEHPVYQRGIARFRLQRQEGGVELNQQVQSLSPECAPHLLHNVGWHRYLPVSQPPYVRHQRMTFFTTARSWSGLNGFTIQAVAPAALPSCFFSGCDSVVNRTIGTNLY